jgi:hypothetical protein
MASDRAVFDGTAIGRAFGDRDRDRRGSRRFDAAELELIAAEIAAGRVTKVPRGVSGLGDRHPWQWWRRSSPMLQAAE